MVVFLSADVVSVALVVALVSVASLLVALVSVASLSLCINTTFTFFLIF